MTHPFASNASAQARRLAFEIRAFINDELLPFERSEGIGYESPVTRTQLGTIWKRSAARGFYGLMLPEHLGGAGLGVVDLCFLKEQIAASEATMFPHILGDFSGPPRVGHLFTHATQYQLRKYLMPIAAGERSVCFALTEPEAGSDAAGITTRAEESERGYVLRGRKRFVTGAPFADIAMVFAVTDSARGAGGISLFFVELDAPGVTVRGGYTPMSGQHIDADIEFENCRLSNDDRLGEPGQGLRLGMARIGLNRLLHCATMLGLARRSVELAGQFAVERRQFGQRIADFQAIQHMLADMHTELYAAQCMVASTAKRVQDGMEMRAEISMCKLFCSETAFSIADRAVQVHGGEGLIRGHPVEWIFRMLRMFRILTGTSEIQRNTIARGVLPGRDAPMSIAASADVLKRAR